MEISSKHPLGNGRNVHDYLRQSHVERAGNAPANLE
jgi:hypothetical protein